MVEVEIYNAEDEIEFNIINSRFLNRLIELNILTATYYARPKYICHATGNIAIPIRPIWRENLIATLSDEEMQNVWIMNSVDNACYFPIDNGKK